MSSCKKEPYSFVFQQIASCQNCILHNALYFFIFYEWVKTVVTLNNYSNWVFGIPMNKIEFHLYSHKDKDCGLLNSIRFTFCFDRQNSAKLTVPNFTPDNLGSNDVYPLRDVRYGHKSIKARRDNDPCFFQLWFVLEKHCIYAACLRIKWKQKASSKAKCPL